MIKTLTAMLILASAITPKLYAGTPATTDSTQPILASTKPTGYMQKYLNTDQRFVKTAGEPYVVMVSAVDSGGAFTSCANQSVTNALGVTFTGVQYIQIGMFGNVALMRQLDSNNYERWSGNWWKDNISFYQCHGNCANPFWVYDYTAAQIICAPVYSDWAPQPV